jgi:hypothetical protein
MFQPCKIDMDHSNQKWPFHIVARLNITCCGKNLCKSTSTTKGHLNQQRQHARSTKVKDPKVIMEEPDLDQGIKTQYVYAAAIDAGQLYTDQTGRLPVVSSKGNKYMLVYRPFRPVFLQPHSLVHHKLRIT